MENGYEKLNYHLHYKWTCWGEIKCMNVWPFEAWMSELWIQKLLYRNACFFPPFLSGIICTCEKLGERASKTSQSKYCNSFGWKQGRPCQQESVGLSGLWCLNSHRRADASCWLYKWDVELFINKQTNMPCRLDFQMLYSCLLRDWNPAFLFSFFTGRTVVCRWQQFVVYGNIGKDFNERERDFHGHWYVMNEFDWLLLSNSYSIVSYITHTPL